MAKDSILVIGASGQIGSVLTEALRNQYGESNVIATDIRNPEINTGIFEQLNVLDINRLSELVDKYKITQIYHLAAILSAKGEANPRGTWDFNMNSLFNVLELAKEKQISKLYFPSSIAVFGNDAPKEKTPQNAVLNPSTIYGMSKVAGEHWSQYFWNRYKLDIRSLRYPGIIGYQSLPGGGTTDYAVDIYHKAVAGEHFNCFLSENTRLPMCYMDDAIRATLELMEADASKLSIRTSYNLSGMDFTPAEIAAAIKNEIPAFTISYAPDFRQAIADSWPQSIDDQLAKTDWGWKPAYDLESMTKDMILHLKK